MVYPGAIPSPGADTTAFEGRDDFSNPDLGSMVESFQSPGRDRDVFARAPAAGKRRTLATPQRQVFGSLTNRHAAAAGGAAARNEFTPLLKSVHRSTLKQKIGRQDFSRPSLAGSSPALPVGDSTTFRTQDEDEEENDTISPGHGLPDSSVGNTPLAATTGGGGAGADGAGPLGGDGLMTLREQEKVIDDIKKENFSLKLKVFFLNERLDKLGPEHRDAALKEVRTVPLPLLCYVD